MADNLKQRWVATILLDRLRYVMKGSAELFIAYYESQVYKMYHLHNRETAIKFWQNYSFKCNEGGTNLNHCIDQVKENIESGNFFETGIDLSKDLDTEILAIHDGKK
jgi:hypothetical protein